MKASVKYIVLVTMAVCFIFPGVIRAACNDANGNNISLSIDDGPAAVGINKQASYTLNAGKTPSSYSWNIPSGFTVVSGVNAKTVTIQANSSPSASAGDKTISCTVSGSNWGPCTKGKGVTIVKVDIAAFDRVVPRAGNEKEVVVTTTPSPAGGTVALSITRTSGNYGAATISTPASASITKTTTIKIQGTQQSWGSGGTTAAPDNMRLKANVSGSATPSDTEDFTICAHVDNIVNQFIGNDGENAIKVSAGWQSDSGELGDLDKCLFREHVTYPSSPWPAPFQAAAPANPYIKPFEGGPAAGGVAIDTHSYPPGLAAIAGYPIDASFTANQWYQYKCSRCVTGWVNEENYTIKRAILPPTATEARRYKVTKTGAGLGPATRTVDLP